MSKVAIVTGSGGLVGSETAKALLREGFDVVGIDNDMRAYFFGGEASTAHVVDELASRSEKFVKRACDIRDEKAIEEIFLEFGETVELVVHTAAQPSHDWAAKEPKTDFGVNAVGTLNLLEAYRKNCSKAVFIFTST
ncbi:MAG: SDR family NAD(P)-dependent oxidoreductase, partial [Verrucomicrobiota bacterium]